MVSIACLTTLCHSVRSVAFHLSVCRSSLHQSVISSVHSRHGLPFRALPSITPNTMAFNISALHNYINKAQIPLAQQDTTQLVLSCRGLSSLLSLTSVVASNTTDTLLLTAVACESGNAVGKLYDPARVASHWQLNSVPLMHRPESGCGRA